MEEIKQLVRSKTHFIFDYDGTLVDLEKLNVSSFQKAFMTVLGVSLSLEDYKEHISGSGSKGGVRQYLLAKNLPMEAYEEIVKLFRSTKDEQVAHDFKSVVSVKPGATEILRFLHENGNKIAIGTSSIRQYVQIALQTFGWEPYISVIVTAEDVEHVKPAPDIFLRAMEEIGGQLENTLIFEDSKNGVAAAQSSGMEYIVLHTKGYNDVLVETQPLVVSDYRECL